MDKVLHDDLIDPGADGLDGGAGADRLTGGLGMDVLLGSADRDIFDLDAIGESPVGAARDVILRNIASDAIEKESIRSEFIEI